MSHRPSILAPTPFIDDDIARIGAIAGDLAESAGWPERARAVRLLAREVWTALGNDEAAARMGASAADGG